MMEPESAEDGGVERLLYKVIVCGDYAAGKTSIIRRYVDGFFTPNYKLTIGVDFSVKDVRYDEKSIVGLQLWDIAGHERFGGMTSAFYRYAIAGVIVFDLSRPATFDAVSKWKQDIDSKVVLADGSPIPVILLANKCDLKDVTVDKERLDRYVKENGFVFWAPTSALENTGIDEAFHGMIGKILEVAKTQAPERTRDEGIDLQGQREKEEACCDI